MDMEMEMGRLHKLNVARVGSLKEPGLYSD